MNRRVAWVVFALAFAACYPAPAAELKGTTVWKGTVTVAEVVTVLPGARLSVAPGAKVVFEGEGRLVCHGNFEARDASFEATSILGGNPRLLFKADANHTVWFHGCALRNLGTKNNKLFLDSFLVAWGAAFTMEDCSIENSSPIEVCNASGPVFRDNRLLRPLGAGLIVAACDRILVSANHFEGVNWRSTMLSLMHASNGRVVGNRFFGDKKDSTGLSIGRGAFGNEVLFNSFFHCGVGIQFWGDKNPASRNKNCDNFLLSNLIFQPLSSGILVAECAEGNTIQNCVVWGAGSAGLDVQGGKQLRVVNCVFAAGQRAMTVATNAATPEVSHTRFWRNSKDTAAELPDGIGDAGNLLDDPQFVAPESGNFRLQSRSFSYATDSPLLGAGMPEGVSIGLFPIMEINGKK